jgi:hypothetical protein
MTNLKSLKTAETAKRMNLADWRASRLHDLTLPSGLPVTVRDVTMTDLLLTGKLPASFVDMAEEAAQNGGSGFDLKQLAKNGEDFRLMLDSLVNVALVSPRIGAQADDEHITLAELPNDDKMAIFNFVNREVNALQSFREGQAEPVAVV